MNIAIIPARGGSKRIPQKNIKKFNGVPIINYSILSALESGLFDRVFVTTDDQKIADVAIEAGAEVPFLRSGDLADDYTGVLPVIQDALRRLDISATMVCCIYATAPFVVKEDLQKGARLLQNTTDASFVISATNYNYPVQRSFIQDENKRLKMLYPDCYTSRSQDLDTVFHDAAMFYMADADVWTESERIYREDAVIFPISENRYCDIDTLDDWCRAEFLAEWNRNKYRLNN